MHVKQSRLLTVLSTLLLIPLLVGCIAICGCFAIIVDADDGFDSASQGRIGVGGSMSIAIDDHWPFEMAVSETEVTLLVQERTIILPHSRGQGGVHYSDFDYDDQEIQIELGGGITAEVDGIHLEVNGREWRLEEVGTYRVDVAGGGYTYTSG